MQEQSGANGAGAAVDMEEPRAQRPCAGAGRVEGGVQEVSKAGELAQTALGLAP